MYSKILVPLDGSKVAEQILPYARFLAEAYRVPVELLSVDDFDSGAPFSSSAGAMSYLKGVAAECFPKSVRVDTAVERGKPAEAIVERAQREPGCLIAMTTHGLSGIKRWLLGSVAGKVVQGGESPVLLARASEAPQAKDQASINSIIVPLDGSELAETVLPTALDLAKTMNTEVVLVRSFEVPPTAYYRTDDVSPVAQPFIPSYDDLVADMQREAGDYLDAKATALRSQGLAHVRSQVRIGPAAEEIIKLACDTRGSLIAMCTHGRSGLKRWVLGSVTETVLRQTAEPVLVVRAG